MTHSSAPTVQDKPILVEILTYAPTQFFHCQHCEFIWQQTGAATSHHAYRDSTGIVPVHSLGAALHQEQLDSSIPDDLKKEYAALSKWVLETVDAYGGRVVFRIIDAASIEGLVKSVRYRARRYPAFIVEGKAKYVGTDFERVKILIDRQMN